MSFLNIEALAQEGHFIVSSAMKTNNVPKHPIKDPTRMSSRKC